MLLRSVFERAFGALFGSAPVADVLCRHLVALRWPTKPNDAPPQLLLASLTSELQAAIQEDVDRRTGSHHRLNEIEASAQMLWGSGFLAEPALPALDTMFNAVIERHGAQVFLRDEQVQRYAELLAEIDPTVLVAWQFAPDAFNATSESLPAFKAAVENLTTLFVGPRFFTHPFAENHAHLGGIVGDDFVLTELILYWTPSAKKSPKPNQNQKDPLDATPVAREPDYLPRLRRIQRLIAAFVTMWKSGDAPGASVLAGHEKALAQACPEDASSLLTRYALDWVEQDQGLVFRNPDTVTDSRWLLKQLTGAASSRDLQHAWTWLFILLWRTYRASTASATLRAIVLLMVVDVMTLRRQLIADGNGLRRFTRNYFMSPLRNMAGRYGEWKGTSRKEAARRVFARPGDRAELKIAAKSFNKVDFTKAFAQVADKRIASLHAMRGTGGASPPNRPALDHWHFCLHLNRTACETRHERRRALWVEARELKVTLASQVPWELAPLAGGGASASRFLPADFVRGLDVAGDETAWPVAVFAPMLRWLRHPDTVAIPMGTRMVPHRPLHFSIHAGEDYAHPLSGLRHVDETVRFCAMRSGDRLGHALALGIPPDKWLARHGDVLLPVDEHVDNLIWAWHEAAELARTGKLEVAQGVQARLEQRIHRFLPYVSWRPLPPDRFSAPLEELYKAWLLRENCSFLVLEQPRDLLIGDSSLCVGAPARNEIVAQVDQPAADVAAGLYVHWAKSERSSLARGVEGKVMVRLTVQPNRRVARAQQDRETGGPDATGQMHDHDNAEDLQFMLALQDACIERYAQMGLSIETNPSSNVYIGQIETHKDHPIYRWDPPDPVDLLEGGIHNRFKLRKIAMPVTINTDDQGIVPTTLRLEHHFMHEAALERVQKDAQADDWIEKLRELGMQHFERTHGVNAE